MIGSGLRWLGTKSALPPPRRCVGLPRTVCLTMDSEWFDLSLEQRVTAQPCDPQTHHTATMTTSLGKCIPGAFCEGLEHHTQRNWLSQGCGGGIEPLRSLYKQTPFSQIRLNRESAFLFVHKTIKNLMAWNQGRISIRIAPDWSLRWVTTLCSPSSAQRTTS